MSIHKFHCDYCNQQKVYISEITTGYAIIPDGRVVCFDCCARIEIDEMLSSGKATLYLTEKNGCYTVGNWPGTIKLPVSSMSVGKHNIARIRHDVWFSLYNQEWHGVQYGSDSQLCHCRKLKGHSHV